MDKIYSYHPYNMFIYINHLVLQIKLQNVTRFEYYFHNLLQLASFKLMCELPYNGKVMCRNM
jgi:hypothetical protein